MAYPYPYPNPCSTSDQPFANPVSIIGPHFCVPYPVDLAFIKKGLVVTDLNSNILFKVKEKFLSHRHVLLDGAGNPIVTLKPKMMTAHQRWQVFKGDSTDASDLLFSARRSSMFQLKSKVDVFLANNTKEEVCDFKVKGSWSERSCVVYAGDSSTIVAQMHKKHTAESILIGKDEFLMTVYPNIDYAFIVALVVVHDWINSSEEGDGGGGEDGGGGDGGGDGGGGDGGGDGGGWGGGGGDGGGAGWGGGGDGGGGGGGWGGGGGGDGGGGGGGGGGGATF